MTKKELRKKIKDSLRVAKCCFNCKHGDKDMGCLHFPASRLFLTAPDLVCEMYEPAEGMDELKE